MRCVQNIISISTDHLVYKRQIEAKGKMSRALGVDNEKRVLSVNFEGRENSLLIDYFLATPRVADQADALL